MTKRRRHTPEQVIRKLREGERMLGEGSDLAAVCKHLEVSEQTWHRWRHQRAGMNADDAKRLRVGQLQAGVPLRAVEQFNLMRDQNASIMELS